MALTITVLTSEAGRTSGYLLRGEQLTVLVDCGPGVAQALRQLVPFEHLDAVVVTHSHADHSLDLMALGYALRFPRPRASPVPLWVPPDMPHLLDRFDALFGVPTLDALRHPIGQSFQVNPLHLDRAARPVEILDGLTLTPRPALHAVPSAALRFSDGNAVVAFSSDTGPTPEIVETARNADVFLCEATYLEADPDVLTNHGHLTAELAGDLAMQASAKSLVLTHLSRPEDAERAIADARTRYPGPVHVACSGVQFTTALSIDAG